MSFDKEEYQALLVKLKALRDSTLKVDFDHSLVEEMEIDPLALGEPESPPVPPGALFMALQWGLEAGACSIDLKCRLGAAGYLEASDLIRQGRHYD